MKLKHNKPDIVDNTDARSDPRLKKSGTRSSGTRSDPVLNLALPAGTPEGFVKTGERGLSEAEALARAAQGLGNKASDTSSRSVPRIIADNLFTLFNLLNVLLAAALLIVGAYRNMLFMGVVVSNTLIGTVQELRARRTVRRLKLLNEAPARVVREGVVREIPAIDAVKGDLIKLKAGDQVIADAIMTEGVCAAGEALLTGEQDAIEKRPGDWLYSGSFLTSGECVCQLVHVGDDSYINRLSRSAKKIIPPRSALMSDLNRIVRFVSVALLPIGILLFCKQFFILKSGLDAAIPSTVAAMVGMIPEGLILLASVALAVGVVRLGMHGTLVQELYGIETLARVDTLCLDKTGTLTTGAMHLSRLEPVDSDEVNFRAALSRFLGAVDNTPPTLAAIAREVPPAPVSRSDPRLNDLVTNAGSRSDPLLKVTALLPFSSDRKNTAVSFSDGITLVLGAPSFTLGERYCGELKAKIEQLAANGFRVLALAECNGEVADGVIPAVNIVHGLCLITDELRAEAPECLHYFKEQGVTVKVISGDDPRTAAAIAAAAGLDGALDNAVDASLIPESLSRGSDLDTTTPGSDKLSRGSDLDTADLDIAGAADKYTVFGRVTPERKQKLVAAMKAAGHVVAMTGDGVNDIPAMKTADCSIAMAGGADAARHSAQLVLMDNDFTALPRVVAEGRRVINNISRTASLFLVKTLYSFALGLLMLFLPAAYPFQPIQLTLVSVITIGLPSFFLALMPNAERVRGGFLRTVLMRAIPGSLAVTVCAATASMLSKVWSQEVCSTLAPLSAGLVGLMMLFTVCLPFDRLRAAVFGGMCVLFALAVLLLPHVFYLVSLSGGQWAAFAGLAAAGAAIVFGARALLNTHKTQV
ncbi:MAG: HAD-IC family P-type ATPase [Clostridia bacterium]|nr:HAD-IC family P-type ATPase [Clostridia bacterium]